MDYNGRLYGKIGNKYFDTSHTSNDWDKMVSKIKTLKAENRSLKQDIESKGNNNSFISLIDRMEKVNDIRNPSMPWPNSFKRVVIGLWIDKQEELLYRVELLEKGIKN